MLRNLYTNFGERVDKILFIDSSTGCLASKVAFVSDCAWFETKSMASLPHSPVTNIH